MSNEDLNPNIPTNNNLSNIYQENIDSTQNASASLFPTSPFDDNNIISPEQNNELSNLFQNKSNDVNNNNISAASSLFTAPPVEQQQAISNEVPMFVPASPTTTVQPPIASLQTTPTRQFQPPSVTVSPQQQQRVQQNQQTSPRSPGTKRGPVFVAPFIPGQTMPAKIITPMQQPVEQELYKYRPPPPIQQQQATQISSIRPPPPIQQPQTTQISSFQPPPSFQQPQISSIKQPQASQFSSIQPPPPIQQQQASQIASIQPPPPVQQPPKNSYLPPPPVQQPPNFQQNQSQLYEQKIQPPPPISPSSQNQFMQNFQPPPPIAKPPPPVTKGPIYIPGQGRVSAASSGEISSSNEAVNQPPVSSQPVVKPPQFAQPPPIQNMATAPTYIPGQSHQQNLPSKPLYVPGSHQTSENETVESKPTFTPPPPISEIKKPPQPSFFVPHESSNLNAANSPSQTSEIKKPPPQPSFFVPHESSTANATVSPFMRPPPMPVPIPVGVPVTRPPEETKRKTHKKRVKTQKKPREAFEPSPVPHFMTPEAVAARGTALPHSQTTGDVNIDDKNDLNDYEYDYEYEYDENSGVKRSTSEPNSVVPISQFTGVFEPFFTKKKPVSALGFGGLYLTRQKEIVKDENEPESGDEKTKKNAGFVNIIKINKIRNDFVTFSPSENISEKEKFVSDNLSSSNEDEQKLLWAAVRVFLEIGSTEFSEEAEINVNSVLSKFRENLKKEGTSESELIKILSSHKKDEIEEEEEKKDEPNESDKTESKSDEDKLKLLDEVQNKIVESGEESALDFAVQNELWPVALIISSSLSSEISQKTVSKYIESELKNKNNGKRFNQLSSILSVVSDVETENFDVSKWKLKLREILLHLTPSSQKTSLLKMASALELNKLSSASLACKIIANLQLAAEIAYFSSHNSTNQAIKIRKGDFGSFIQSIIEESPTSLQVLQIAQVLVTEKVENEKLMTNLSILNAAAHSDYGFESKSREELDKLKKTFDSKDGDCLIFAKRFLDNLNKLTEKVTEESLKVVPLRKEDVPPPPKPETESNNFFVPMAAFIPGLNTNLQQQNSLLQNQPNQPSFFTPNASAQPNQQSFFTPNSSSTTQNQQSFYSPNSSLTQQRSIDLYASSDNYDNSEDKNRNETDDDNKIRSTTTKSEPESKPKSSESQEKPQENQQKRGWFSSIFTKLNPFGSSKIVDLSQHDNGEMVWNGHRYVMKGHENDDDSQNRPPPPPKGLAPISKAKSSPFPITEPQKVPPPPGEAAVSPASPPPSVGPPPPASGSIASPPIGAVAPVGRTRVSKRYVANF